MWKTSSAVHNLYTKLFQCKQFCILYVTNLCTSFGLHSISKEIAIIQKKTLLIPFADRPAELCVLLEVEGVLHEGLREEGCQAVLVGILVGRIHCEPVEDNELNPVTQHWEDRHTGPTQYAQKPLKASSHGAFLSGCDCVLEKIRCN